MTRACDEVWPMLLDGQAGEAERAHAATCPDCQAAVEAFGALASAEAAPSSPPVLPEALQSELKRTVWGWKWAALATTLVGALFVAFGLWKAWNGMVPGVPRAFGLPLAFLFAASVGLGTLAGIRPGTKTVRTALPWLMGALFVGVLVCATGTGPEGPFWSGIVCAEMELMVAVVPLLVGLFALRNTAFSVARAVSLGAGCAAIGLVALTLFCPQGRLGHLVAFHLLPAVLLMGAAPLLRRLLPTRSHAP